MMFRAAIVLIALAVPAFAQHGGAHAGSFGSRGFAGHSGFSGSRGFSGPGSFARPAPPVRYGALGSAGYRRTGPPNYSSLRNPYIGNSSLSTPYNGNRYNANRLTAVRPTYDPRGASLSRGANPDRDRFDARRREFQTWVVNTYPYWPGYPYLIGPNSYNLGLYDWGDSDNSEPGSSETDEAYDQSGPAPLYPPPYPGQGYYAPGQQPAPAPLAAPSAPASEQLLTVIFKSGRAPIKVQNYLMTARVFTDLDRQHYEQISLDLIDLAATQRFNNAVGVDFQVPGAARD
jgi:hypothetical protein